MNYEAKHIPEKQMYTVDLGEGHQAILTYSDRNGVRHILHTEVPAELRGGGYGKILMEAVLSKMDEEQIKVLPICSYARIYMQRNKKWAHLLG